MEKILSCEISFEALVSSSIFMLQNFSAHGDASINPRLNFFFNYFLSLWIIDFLVDFVLL